MWPDRRDAAMLMQITVKEMLERLQLAAQAIAL
jgi:hypothetical protein